MDPSDLEDEAAAMAAAIGFSTFGSKKPSVKKRKFNAATDAFVDGDELASIDKGGKKGQGSGGNEVPLGKTRVLGVRSKNEGEIDLDDDRDEDGPRYIDTSLPPPVQGGFGYGVGNGGREREQDDGPRCMDTSLPPPADGPAYMDTSLPPPIESSAEEGPAYMDTSLPLPAAAVSNINDDEAREMQKRIDAILASIQPPPRDEDGDPTILASPTLIKESPRPNYLPPKPSFGNIGGMFGGRGTGMSDTTSVNSGRTRGRGERNAEWYLGYYDHSFNENPWEKLERQLGLEPVGSWIERPRGGVGGSRNEERDGRY